MKPVYSVLMSVYHRADPVQLDQCLASLVWQSRLADQVVIVLDGPVPDSIQSRLTRFKADYPNDVELVSLPQNMGLSRALNEGLSSCQGEWILRMDADDLAMPDRFAKQIDWLETHPELDVLGSALFEFSEDPEHPERVKPVLEGHAEIATSIGLRSPINHPTACIRKSRLIEAGGYPELPLLEDYFLWAKLLLAGATFHNLPEPLYLFRFNAGTLLRRRGMANFQNETWLRRWMLEHGLISRSTAFMANTLQLLLRFAPAALQSFLWRRSRQNTTTKLTLPKPQSFTIR